jgi:photosystem II stability/assembly factor-like uncharacterized protein
MFWYTAKIHLLLTMQHKTMDTSNHLLEDHIYQLNASKKLTNEMIVCFAARLSGLYRSTDGGQIWTSAFESLNLQDPLTALAVALSPDFEHDANVFVGLNGGILRSFDGGQHWENAQVPTPPPIVTALAVSPNFAEDGILFSATLEDGILSSVDRGRHWNAWNFGLLDLNTLCIAISPDFANDETIYVGTQSGIFRSTNGGRAWREVNLSSVGFDAVLSLALSPEFAHDGTLFAGTENEGLFRSKDGGQTWQRLGKPKLKEPVNTILLAPNFPAQPELLVLHGDKLLTSTDCGKSWQPWRDNLTTGKSVVTILCPNGFAPGVSALVGYTDGTIEFMRSN